MRLKWLLIWTFLHAISWLFVSFAVSLVVIRNPFIELILLASGVTVLANIYRIFTQDKEFILNAVFVFWIAVNSIAIWLLVLIIETLHVTNFYGATAIMGFGLVTTSYIVNVLHMLRLRGLKMWVIIAVIFSGLFLLNDNPSLIFDNSKNTSQNLNLSLGSTIANFVDALKSRISKIFDSGCPQINVSMKEHSWYGQILSEKEYDGWAIEGEATCRKGNQENENVNYYYCGGYSSTFGIGRVNAYIEKTIISQKGDIGKTYKYVIWNVYDENKRFLETNCIGNPDEFEEKQARAFYNELQKWS